MRVAWPEDVWESKLDVKVESEKSTTCFMFNEIGRDVTHKFFLIHIILLSAHLFDFSNVIVKGNGT